MQSEITVYFDYLCPFAWRGAEVAKIVADEAGVKFSWRHFSLMQSNTKDPSYQIWNQKLDDEDPSGSGGLLAFLASGAARRQGEEAADSFRIALLRHRHKDHGAFTPAAISQVAESQGLDMERFEADLNDPELRTQLAQEHHQATERGVFGTPTFRFADGNTSYFRIRELPQSDEEALDLFNRYRDLLHDFPYLETLKRPREAAN